MITARCHHCGLQFESAFFRGFRGNATNLSLAGNRETCPRCGRLAETESGVFEIRNGIVTNLTVRGVRRADVVEFKRVVSAVIAGDIEVDEADEKIQKLGVNFSEVWRWMGENNEQLMLLLTIITLLLTTYFHVFSDGEDPNDAATIERQNNAIEKILQELSNRDGDGTDTLEEEPKEAPPSTPDDIA